jgi:selenocysteine-specific elongation factor
VDSAPSHPRRVVVGTAGHVDHGKTALVKALTGVDCDRWEEEQRRGITIDLGFAPLLLGDDIQASVVDVPGHEGFVRNMLAGATGIDVALLVIAADEGIMPQTEEHLAIVELLGISRGIPVLTKRDLAEPEWLELVRGEVTERLRSSRVRWEPVIAVSALAGTGLDELRATLRRVAGGVAERPVDDWFRLPIDRVFALPGAGTIVTGSTWSGTLAVGDAVSLLPLGRSARVRSIEVHGQRAVRTGPGQRTALALVGVDRTELARGHVAVMGTGWTATTALDAAVELLPAARRPIAGRTRLRVHLGTAEVLARVVHGRSILPGERGLVRLLLEAPLVARGGDRFVLRSFSPVTTIGGGVVLDPTPPPSPSYAKPGLTGRRLGLRESPSDRLVSWAHEAGLDGMPIAALAVRLGVPAGSVTGVIDALGDSHVTCGEYLVARGAIESAVVRLAALLRHYHGEHPLDPGMSLQALRAAITVSGNALDPPASVLDHVLAAGIQARGWEVEGGIAREVGWRPALDAHATVARRRLLQRLTEAQWQIPTLAELERDFRGEPVQALVAHLVREGAIEQVDRERVAPKQALEGFRRALEAALRELGAATPAQLRDRLGLTRKYLIPLLEWADRRGITQRAGAARTLARLTIRSSAS